MEEYLQLACINQESARRIVTDLQIEKLWGEIGAEINLVGSLKSGLLCKHRDIDFHVYTEKVTIAESFSVILKICKNPQVKKFWFKNLLNTGEDCLEWHLTYLDDNGKDWQIDIIHMPKGSRYDGYFENFANRLCEIMTEEERLAILRLKYETPDCEKIAGVEYYRAVIEGGIRTFEDFSSWREENRLEGILDWMP